VHGCSVLAIKVDFEDGSKCRGKHRIDVVIAGRDAPKFLLAKARCIDQKNADGEVYNFFHNDEFIVVLGVPADLQFLYDLNIFAAVRLFAIVLAEAAGCRFHPSRGTICF
jgi:hypothetical protein